MQNERIVYVVEGLEANGRWKPYWMYQSRPAAEEKADSQRGKYYRVKGYIPEDGHK